MGQKIQFILTPKHIWLFSKNVTLPNTSSAGGVWPLLWATPRAGCGPKKLEQKKKWSIKISVNKRIRQKKSLISHENLKSCGEGL